MRVVGKQLCVLDGVSIVLIIQAEKHGELRQRHPMWLTKVSEMNGILRVKVCVG